MNTTEVENFPGFPDGVMGPDLMDRMRKQAERFGAELVTDDVVEVDLTGDVKVVTDAPATSYRAKAVILATGSRLPRARASPTRSGSPATASRGAPPVTASSSATRTSPSSAAATPRSRRRPSSPGSPRSVTIVHRRDALRASKIMQDRAFANDEDPLRLEQRGRRDPRRRPGSPACGCATPRPARRRDARRRPALFVAIGHDPRTELFTGQVDLDDEGYVARRAAEHPHQPAPASSPPATSSTTPTGRPSPRPAPAARPPSTPSATSPPSSARPATAQAA